MVIASSAAASAAMAAAISAGVATGHPMPAWAAEIIVGLVVWGVLGWVIASLAIAGLRLWQWFAGRG